MILSITKRRIVTIVSTYSSQPDSIKHGRTVLCIKALDGSAIMESSKHNSDPFVHTRIEIVISLYYKLVY